MVVDEQFGRSYNMTREAAEIIVDTKTPVTIYRAGSPSVYAGCFWCAKPANAGVEEHWPDCVRFIAIRVIQLTDAQS